MYNIMNNNFKDKKYDSIPFRIEFIKYLLKDNKLKSMIAPKNCNTEQFINPDKKNNSDDNSNSFNSHDTRNSLKKETYNFDKIMNKIGGNLLYVRSGTTGHTFKGTIQLDNNNTYNYAIKVVAYPKKEKYGDLFDTRRPENAELMMIRLLSYFVVKGQTPHIVLPIGTFYTSIKRFVTLIDDEVVSKNNKKYVEFVQRYNKGDYYNQVSVLISEWANRGDFLEFIRKNYKKFKPIHWKVFFFQIISTLAIIHSKFPTFRHNDLKANNMLVHNVSKKSNKYSYIILGKEYIVPNIGFHLKMWDFDFACIPGIVDNKKVLIEWTNGINITPEKNRYYDIHYFFNTLIKKGFFEQFMIEPEIPKEAKDFVNRIVPPKYQQGRHVHDRGRILINDEYITPEEILRLDPYFEEFRKYKIKEKKSDNMHVHNQDLDLDDILADLHMS